MLHLEVPSLIRLMCCSLNKFIVCLLRQPISGLHAYPYFVDGQHFGWGYQLLLTITCQMLGLGLAGLTRKFLVEPAAMIWPSNLVRKFFSQIANMS